jgi:glyoxylase-like metal-dependent hydrolase (beta-lactamase superfamily II)
MDELKLLIQGYAKKTKQGYQASSAVVLIRTNGLNILVDPGSNKERLLRALKREKINPADIDFIFLTHFHLDHILNIRLFPQATILDVDTIYKKDGGVLYKEFIPGTEIRAISTPGHAHEHGVLIIDTEEGRVGVAGDIFWWNDNEKQKTDFKSLVYKKDPYTKNWKQLVASRKKLLKLADWIIPGHGKVFKIEK